jgi:hypothetical protein
LFFDIQIKIHFFSNKTSTSHLVAKKTDYEKFVPITLNKRKFIKKSKKELLHLTSFTKQTFLKLTDIQGENLLKKRSLLHVK